MLQKKSADLFEMGKMEQNSVRMASSRTDERISDRSLSFVYVFLANALEI